jgi:hypothetical protein
MAAHYFSLLHGGYTGWIKEAHHAGGKRHRIKTKEALQLWFEAVEGNLAAKELAIKRRAGRTLRQT